MKHNISPFIFGLLCSGCLAENTCSDGATWQNPQIINGIESDENTSFVRLSWETGRLLPDEYFESIKVRCPDTDVCLDTPPEYTTPNVLKVFLKTSELPQLYAHSFELQLEFSDRREFIDCTHPGTNDRYFVSVYIYLDEYGDIILTQFEEAISYGYL